MAKSFSDLPPSVQTLILVILALAVVIAPSYYYVYPLFGEKAKKEATLAQDQKDVAELRAIEQKLPAYQAEIKALDKKLGDLRLVVPDTPEMDKYLKLVYADAGNTAIHVRTFVPSPPVQQKYYVELPVQIRIDGTYWQMVNFFDRLAHETRIVSVTSIGLGTPKGGGLGAYEVGENETVGANCVVTTYYNHPQQPAAPAKGPAVTK